MVEIARWGGHKFEMSPELIRSFTGLTIKGASETKDTTKKKEKYLTRKNSQPVEVSLTVNLNRATGVDVRKEALTFVEQAYNGASDYFYVGSRKLVSCKLMLTDAQVSDILVEMGGILARANVKLTLKQCDKYSGTSAFDSKHLLDGRVSVYTMLQIMTDGSGSGSGGGDDGGGGSSGGSSRKSKSRRSRRKSGGGSSGGSGSSKDSKNSRTSGTDSNGNKVSKAVQTIKRITTAARKSTAAKKTGGGSGKFSATAKK